MGKVKRSNLILGVFVPLENGFLTAGPGKRRLWEQDWKRSKMTKTTIKTFQKSSFSQMHTNALSKDLYPLTASFLKASVAPPPPPPPPH